MPARSAKRAVIYTRISRDDTGEGAANQRQEEDCRKLADLRGWEVVAVQSDISISGYSGKERPGWNRVLDMIRDGEVDVVLAWHMDRMTRSMLDLEKLILLAEEHGVGVATVTGDIDLTTDVGRMVARIIAAVARAEVERKGARQRRANEQRAAQGLPWKTGFRAFGYTHDGEIVEHEAALIREAAEDVLNGTPLRAIVRRWKELGVPTARSRKNVDGWTHNSVRAILLNPRNAGIATYKGEPIGKGQWEPIISQETHVLLVATLTDPARTRGDDKKLGNKPRNLLSGLATCGVCGWKVEAGSHGGRKVYKCSNPEGEHLTTDRKEADNIVRAAMHASIALTLPGTVLPTRDRKVPSVLWAERQRLNERLEKLALSFANGVLTDGQLQVATEALRKQLADVEAQIETAAEPDDASALTKEQLDQFATADVYGQRRVLEQLAEIKLWPRNGKKSLPLKYQVTVYVTDQRGTTWPALDERKNGVPEDPALEHYKSLATLLVERQPEGTTTLREAAQWLVDNGHTQRSASGLQGKLSPLVWYVRGERRGGPEPFTGWMLK